MKRSELAMRLSGLLLILPALLGAAPGGRQQNAPRIAYVYPAGGQQGTTFQVHVGGQALNTVNTAIFSDPAIRVTLVEHKKPMSRKEFNDLQAKLDELRAKPKDAATLLEIAEVRKKLATFVRMPNPMFVETVTLEITVARDVEPGAKEFRLDTATGISNPLVFHVGQLEEFREPEPPADRTPRRNGEPENPANQPEMKIALPVTLNGRIMPGDVDRYRFTARKGQRLVMAASARELIPYLADAVPGWFQATLALFDADGTEVAYVDDYRFHPDPVLFAQIPRDGEYVIEIKDAIYRGREDFIYRITVGELPFVTSIFPLGGQAGDQTEVEVKGWNLPAARLTQDGKGKEPGIHSIHVRKGKLISNFRSFAVDTLPESLEKELNNGVDTAQAVTLPVIVNGRIDQPGDLDVFRIEGKAGDEVVAEVLARRLDSPLDSILTLTDGAGKQVAYNDDSENKSAGLTTHHADSHISIQFPADGVYYLQLTDAQHKGGPEYAYRLRISPRRPDFDLRIVPSSLNVRGAGGAPVTVYALRKDGFTGEITLKLKNTPAGLTLSGKVPADQEQATLTLKGTPRLLRDPVALTVEGHATINGREVVHPGVPAEDMMQAFAYRHLVPAQQLMASAGAGGSRPQDRKARDDSLKAASTLVANYVARKVGLAADKTSSFVTIYVAERLSALDRMRSAWNGADRPKLRAAMAENANAMRALLHTNLTREQVKTATATIGPLSGLLEMEVASLLEAKVPQDKIEKAIPVLSTYASSLGEVYDKTFAGRLAREDQPARIKELRISTAKELALIIGENGARQWAERPRPGLSADRQSRAD